MEQVTISPLTNTRPTRDETLWQSAERIQLSLFTDLLRYGGLADALSTGSDSLDYWNQTVSEEIAQDLVRQSPELTERLYQQLSGLEDGKDSIQI